MPGPPPEKWGTGRRDYSVAVEESVQPTIRGYQANATSMKQFTLNAGEQKEIDVPMDFREGAESHNIARATVSTDANVLIGVGLWFPGGTYPFLAEYGYQTVEIEIPMSLGISDMSAKITNHGDIAVNAAYSHNGLQGLQEIFTETIFD